MGRAEKVELTVLCLIRDGDRILLQHRVKADWRGCTLPGGHVEPGESVVDAVRREIREETGLTLPAPRLAGIKQFPIEGGRYMVFLFTADRFEGTLSSSPEGRMEWVERKNLGALDTVADFDALLRVMEDPRLTEFQYLVRGEEWTVRIR